MGREDFFDVNGTFVIGNDEGYEGTVAIPKDVTGIMGYSLSGCKSITTIKIPESLVKIDYRAFYSCASLKEIIVEEKNPKYCSKDGVLYSKDMSILYVVPKCKDSIEIPDSVTEIGTDAFCGCKSITSIKIPGSVSSIGDYAFSGCSSLKEIIVEEENPKYCSREGVLYSKDMKTLIAVPGGKDTIEIPDSVTKIGAFAFWCFSSLTSILIPNSVTKIGRQAFYGCSSLTSIEIPDSVKGIEDWAFGFCTSLTSIVIPDSVTWIGDSTFHKCTSLTSIEIPGRVTWIGDYAFSGCTSLTSIEIPSGVTEIERDTFKDCTSLTSIKIPDSVNEIESNRFEDCTSLKEILVGERNPNYCSKDGVLYSKDMKSLILVPGGKDSIEIPDSVTRIEEGAFDCSSSLKKIVVRENNLNYCSRDGVLYSKDMSKLISVPCCKDSIEIPDGVTEIGYDAFCGCESLPSIKIPDSVTEIEYNAFYGCTSLREIHLKHKNPLDFSHAFETNVTIYVPKGSGEVYRNSEYYKKFKEIIEEE